MRSALAYALRAEGLDDRTVLRTIAYWRATRSVEIMRLVDGLCAHRPPQFKLPVKWGICR